MRQMMRRTTKRTNPDAKLVLPVVLLAAAGALAAAGCGGGQGSPPRPDMGMTPIHDGGPGDTVHPDAPIPRPFVLALGTDFTSGIGTLAVINPATMSVTKMAGTAAADAMIRSWGDGDRVYVVNRMNADNVEVLSASGLVGGAADPLLWQMSTGTGTDPNDVVPYNGSTLYVPRYTSGQLATLDYAGGAMKGTVDLSSYDPDKQPEMHSAFYKNGLVWVSMQLLDTSYNPEGPGQVVAIDPATNRVKASVTLTTANPTTLLVDEPGTNNLLIGTTPSYSVATMGCIERIDTAAMMSKGCAVTNAVLGGPANHFQVEASGTWVLAVSPNPSSTSSGQLETWTPGGGAPKVLSTASEAITDCAALADGTVFASDTSPGGSGGGVPGVRAYAPDGIEKTGASAPLDIGLRPQFTDGLAVVYVVR